MERFICLEKTRTRFLLSLFYLRYHRSTRQHHSVDQKDPQLWDTTIAPKSFSTASIL